MCECVYVRVCVLGGVLWFENAVDCTIRARSLIMEGGVKSSLTHTKMIWGGGGG